MLELDLLRLQRERRIRIEDRVPADSPIWAGTGLRLTRPLEARLEAQQSGQDVVVRGRLRTCVEVECRRCLVTVLVDVDEPVSLVFRAGVGQAEAERHEVYPLPAGTRGLDLAEPVREHVLLAVPPYPVCREACRGLCPRCGANLNEGSCGCTIPTGDERWAELRRMRFD